MHELLDGEAVVRTARSAVAKAVGARSAPPPPVPPPAFAEPRGVFVTLKRYPSGALRGCIGYPLPRFPLGVALGRAARAAAVEDPRFAPVRPEELAQLTVEVSVLSVPRPLPYSTPAEAISAVRVGVDGLIVEADGTGGLLLPQVAPEQGWTAEEFLDGVCEKAGLPRNRWRSPGVRLETFQAEIVAERSPDGPIDRVVPSVPAARAARRS